MQRESMDRTERKALVEALIFASDIPLTADKIKQLVENVTKKEIEEIISELQNDYELQARGFQIKEVANGYQFRTQPAFAFWLKKLKKTKPFRLTQPTLETLAIIAYKQPITRLEIEKIRGVDTGGVIKTLLEKRLICIAGRKNVPGKPFLLGTTKTFLEIFSLENLSSLPVIKELEDLDNAQLPSILRDRMTQNVVYDEADLSAELEAKKSTEGQAVSENVLQAEEPVAKSIITEPAHHTDSEYSNGKESSGVEN
jgi:segregation and condensation protein B